VIGIGKFEASVRYTIAGFMQTSKEQVVKIKYKIHTCDGKTRLEENSIEYILPEDSKLTPCIEAALLDAGLINTV
jgi:FKBP-type peptidyl-prolyl cis-trans isomerase 2